MQNEEKFIQLMNAGDESTTKRDAKASVFTDVFSMPAYGYVAYARELDRNIQKFGRKQEAAVATVQYCIEHDILREYFVTRGMEEVVNLMMTLFDDETIMRNHDARMLREGEAKGKAKAENRLKKLTNILHAAGRIDDIVHAAGDPEYADKLCKELGIS